MVTELLAKVSLDDNDDTFTDITSLLISKSQSLKNDTVIKNPSFSLFEGTHALEIMNAKLDSGLISLSEEEIDFDVVKERSLKEVCWLSDSIFRSLFVWLNNSTLAQTLLSNRYVEELLRNYSSNPNDELKSCIFNKNSQENNKLINLVLKNVILGCLFFARFGCTLVQSGAVYEEEDINAQVMGLNLLSTIQLDDVFNELRKANKYLIDNYNDDKDSLIIQNIILILLSLLKLPLFLNTRIPEKSENIKYNVDFLDQTLVNIKFLQDNLDYINSLDKVEGCYTLGIQKRLDNNSPPRQLLSFTLEDYSSLDLLISDFKQIFTIMEREEPKDIITHSLNFANTNHHSISRAFYPIFLIRDDKTILGNESVNEFLIQLLNEFSCFNSELFNNENQIAKNKSNEIIELLSVQFLESLSVMNQNPCRQRQHLSRLIIQFDSLQANSEQLEITLNEVFQFKDEFLNRGEKDLTLAIPLTSWIYYAKLDIMISVVLRGFELDLYKIWEFHSMYWYLNYLLDNILSLLDRVVNYNLYKIESIKSMKLKLKKKKGEQKLKYKEKYEFKLNYEIPKLLKINEEIDQKILNYKILKSLSNLQSLNLMNLINNDLIKTPNFPFAKNIEMLYNLRMKPFSTVGIPHFPNFSQYLQDTKLTKINDDEFKSLRFETLKNTKEIIDNIESSNYSDYLINKDSWISWYKLYQKSCIGIGLNAYKGQSPDTHKVVIESDGFHRYFPIVKLVSK